MAERQIDFRWDESVFAIIQGVRWSVRPEVDPWAWQRSNTQSVQSKQNFSEKGGKQNAQNQSQQG